MNIECLKERLVDAISKAEKITGRNLTLPVLNCILLEAKNNTLTLRATNLDLGIEITIPVNCKKEGILAIPGQILHNFVSHISGDKNITLKEVEGNLEIVAGDTKTLIKALNYEDFPTIPQLVSANPITISSKDLVYGVKAVSYSSAVSSMKPELSSVYIYQNDNDLIFVATDSFRLAEKKIKIKGINIPNGILLPVKNVSEIIHILQDYNGEVTASISTNQISFRFAGTYLTSRVVEGIFPDYKQIIPKEYTTSVTVLKQDIISTTRIATIFSDKFNKLSIKVRPKDGLFEFSTRNSDVGENTSKIEAVVEGEDIDINFNYKYILDCLQSIETDSIIFEFSGPNKALVVKGVGDKSFMYLVMPMNK